MSTSRQRRFQRRAEERIKNKLARDGKAVMKVPDHIAKMQVSIDLEELHRTGQTQIKGFRSDIYGKLQGPSSE